MIEKPPLGLMPKYIWNQRRALDIITSIHRYIEAGMPIPLEWIVEYNELIAKISQHKTNEICPHKNIIPGSETGDVICKDCGADVTP